MVAEPVSQPAASAPEEGGRVSPQKKIESKSRPRNRWWLEITIAAVIVVGAIVATYVVVETSHKYSSGSSSGTILVPAGTLYSIADDQYNAFLFDQNSTEHLDGTITNVGGAQIYVMSPSQYFHLITTYDVDGYEWTTGPIASDTYYQLEVTIPGGAGWDLVFANSVPGNSTAIGFYTNLVESP